MFTNDLQAKAKVHKYNICISGISVHTDRDVDSFTRQDDVKPTLHPCVLLQQSESTRACSGEEEIVKSEPRGVARRRRAHYHEMPPVMRLM